MERVSTVYTTYASMNNRKLSHIAVFFPEMEIQKELGRGVFEVVQLREQCSDNRLRALLQELERLLIQQFVTVPILRSLNLGVLAHADAGKTR